MATIRKRGSRYNVQIRKEGYPSVAKTFTHISVARKWANSIEADMERRIHVEVPDQTTVGELLQRYQRQISPSYQGPTGGSLQVRDPEEASRGLKTDSSHP